MDLESIEPRRGNGGARVGSEKLPLDISSPVSTQDISSLDIAEAVS
jgi:hypothetical protein